MIVTRNHVTGWPTDVLTSLRRSLGQYTRYGRFKIGITGNPNGRAQQYDQARLPYTEMIVLYRTDSKKFVRAAESELIFEYGEYCDNSIAGGGGDVKGPPLFLYIVR